MNYDTTIDLKSKTKMQEKIDFGQIMLTAAIFLVMFTILTNPLVYAKSVLNGLTLFFTAVLPGLLPFMFLTKIIINLNLTKITKFFNTPAKKILGLNGYATYGFLSSCISGYPVGAKLTSELYMQNKINERQLLKTALLCSTSGPIFIIGTVGVMMLNNFKIGVILYLINICATFLSVLIIKVFRLKKLNIKNVKQDTDYFTNHDYLTSTEISNINRQKSTLNTISQAASDTAVSLLTVAFYIAFFCMFIDILTNIKILQTFAELINIPINNKNISHGTVSGLIEITRGIQILSSSHSAISLSIISALLSFGGFSIIFQSLSFLNATPLKSSHFILGKVLQGFTAFTISFILFSFIL